MLIHVGPAGKPSRRRSTAHRASLTTDRSSERPSHFTSAASASTSAVRFGTHGKSPILAVAAIQQQSVKPRPNRPADVVFKVVTHAEHVLGGKAEMCACRLKKHRMWFSETNFRRNDERISPSAQLAAALEQLRAAGRRSLSPTHSAIPIAPKASSVGGTSGKQRHDSARPKWSHSSSNARSSRESRATLPPRSFATVGARSPRQSTADLARRARHPFESECESAGALRRGPEPTPLPRRGRRVGLRHRRDRPD